MGLGLFKASSCSCDYPTARIPAPPAPPATLVAVPKPAYAPLPEPEKRHQILQLYVCGRFVVAAVRFLDSTNYEGLKCLVYEARVEDIERATFLDPHFCETGRHLVPIARFEPTDRGWEMACSLVVQLKT